MKKFLIVACSLCILFVITVCASASLSEESKDLSVNYIAECCGVSISFNAEKVSGHLPDGTEFSVDRVPSAAKTVRIYPVQKEEKDVLEWLDKTLPENREMQVTYYIACFDDDGNKLSNEGLNVDIDAPQADKEIAVYSLTGDGTATLVSTVEKDGKISFIADSAHLYAFCVEGTNPPTSDKTVWSFLVITLTSGALLCLLSLKKRFKTST